ncbi:MAG: hypothetical protein ACJ72A_12750 [Nocardioidaceae bacterium]
MAAQEGEMTVVPAGVSTFPHEDGGTDDSSGLHVLQCLVRVLVPVLRRVESSDQRVKQPVSIKQWLTMPVSFTEDG